jgi:hypothetical protein
VTNTAKGVNKDFVLYQCGTAPPATTDFANGTVFVQVPVKAAASLTTTSVVFIEMLGKRSALKVVDTEGLVSSPCVQLGLEKGEIVGLEDKNLALRAEQFKGADLVFGGSPGENGTETKTVITSEVSDPGPLNVSFCLLSFSFLLLLTLILRLCFCAYLLLLLLLLFVIMFVFMSLVRCFLCGHAKTERKKGLRGVKIPPRLGNSSGNKTIPSKGVF